MGEYGARDGTTPVEPTLLHELTRVKDAGNALAEAAHRVQTDYDGVHRLRLALAGWYQALADEFGRAGTPPGDRATDVLLDAFDDAYGGDLAEYLGAEWREVFATVLAADTPPGDRDG